MQTFKEINLRQCVKGYCGGGQVFSAEEWLPLFGYIKNGQIVGTMYQGTTIMPSPVHVHWQPGLHNKEGFDNWVNHTFVNLDNINEAVGRVKETLNLTDYKVCVFPSLFDPNAGCHPGWCRGWGSLDGVDMDIDNPDHCLRIIRYMAESYINEFPKHHYEHVKLTGFYWFDEGLDLHKFDWYKRMTALIHETGYLTLMSPYYKSSGYSRCFEAGFDLVSMQTNYFPDSTIGSLSCGTKDRVALALDCGLKNGIGLEPELNGPSDVCVTAFKYIMKTSIEMGCMMGFHLHYFNGSVLSVYNSDDDYIHSLYDELYEYIQGTLDPEKIWFKDVPNAQKTMPYHILKGYCFDHPLSVEEWLPVIAYVDKDGTIQDTMYERVTIQPSPVHIYHGDFNTKEKWDAWIHQQTFCPGKGLDALEEAAEHVKQALHRDSLSVGVFFTLPNPYNPPDNPNYYDNWGELNGIQMDVSNADHRFEMVKYMIDTYLQALESRHYKNVGFNGFYWFDEFIRKDDIDWYVRVNDYIRTKSCFSLISPYYRATGFDLCYRAGFELVTMQSNYFPNGTVGILNCGSEERLTENAKFVKENGMGIEMELDDPTTKDGITGFKKTLKVCLENGNNEGLHVHYFGNGPFTLLQAAYSEDTYFRSFYDELYAYMKKTLTSKNIRIDPLEQPQKTL